MVSSGEKNYAANVEVHSMTSGKQYLKFHCFHSVSGSTKRNRA